MDGTGIAFPIYLDQRARDPGIDVTGFYGQSAVQHAGFLSVPPEQIVTRRNLLQGKEVAWIKINSALQTLQRFPLLTATPLNVALQLKNQRIVRQTLTGHFQLGEGAIIIKVTPIKIFGTCQVCFPRVRSKAERSLNR